MEGQWLSDHARKFTSWWQHRAMGCGAMPAVLSSIYSLYFPLMGTLKLQGNEPLYSNTGDW